ncbi:hypothetical protein F4009_16750 [Candidatus Poribacteria bacterium]|nr:hypothetical protein [Candidatus Poribacteria bacterium]MYH79109.1 hypothetical protein [Candidatus Poribacteria bacterium]MYK95620.1 hypothetical protein [Candidatus Poribacteria bacterium]
MHFQSFRQNVGFLIGIAILSLFVSSPTFAQEGASISGRVVNEDREAVAGILIAVQPYKVMGNVREEGFVEHWQRQTDSEGRFSITDIMAAESVRFVVEGKHGEQTEIQVLSIEMGELTLYPNDHPHFRGMPFSLEGGMEIENTIIKVKTDIRPQVRARVVFADGTPVTDTRIYTRILRRDLDGSGGGSSGSTAQTDADGYFVENLRVDDDPQFYVLGVEHQGLFAKASPFILHDGQPQIYLLLTLNGNPVPLAERPVDPPTSDAFLRAFIDPPSVWIVNPANGHAYKRIYCHDVVDAMDQATAENAYVVSINDKAENEWLQGIFERERFWIGLSDDAEEGRWIWHSGEPVTYTNWGEDERDGGNTEMKDYVVVGFGGRWEVVAPGAGGQAHFIKRAILERPEPPAEVPSTDN